MPDNFNTSQPRLAALEKIPAAARRMGTSTSNFYRIAKRDGLRIVKLGKRASAVLQGDVDVWISARVAECMGKNHAQ